MKIEFTPIGCGDLECCGSTWGVEMQCPRCKSEQEIEAIKYRGEDANALDYFYWSPYNANWEPSKPDPEDGDEIVVTCPMCQAKFRAFHDSSEDCEDQEWEQVDEGLPMSEVTPRIAQVFYGEAGIFNNSNNEDSGNLINKITLPARKSIVIEYVFRWEEK